MPISQNPRQYPSERYYYGWYGDQQQQPAQPSPQTDSQIKVHIQAPRLACRWRG